MGTSAGQGVTVAPNTMRAVSILLLAAAAVNAEAEADAYTIGQVAHGYGHGIVTGVDYGYGHVNGYGAIGNRGYYGGYGGHLYGKREADSDAYTIGQVAHGYGYGVVTGVDYGYGRVSGYG